MTYRATLLILLLALPVGAASIRDRMRPTDVNATAVNETQAGELNLTVAPVAEQSVQTVVRAAATLDTASRMLTAEIGIREGALVQAGQRARAYQLSSRASMYQAKVTRVGTRNDRVFVEAVLTSQVVGDDAPYLLEIAVDRGRFLAVPNAAIIEEGDKHIVYMRHHPGVYMPMEIQTGIQGELYTQVLDGLNAGDEIVTFGSFFVDAEYKLKSSGAGDAAMGHEHHH